MVMCVQARRRIMVMCQAQGKKGGYLERYERSKRQDERSTVGRFNTTSPLMWRNTMTWNVAGDVNTREDTRPSDTRIPRPHAIRQRPTYVENAARTPRLSARRGPACGNAHPVGNVGKTRPCSTGNSPARGVTRENPPYLCHPSRNRPTGQSPAPGLKTTFTGPRQAGLGPSVKDKPLTEPRDE